MRKTVSILIIAVMILVTLGIVMLASTSGIRGGDPYFYTKRQLIWMSLSILVCVVCSRIPYRFWRSAAIPLTLVTIALLIAVFLPGIGRRVGGSNRWVRIGPIGFQASELAKISVIMLLAWYMSLIQRRPDEFLRGLVIPMVCLGTILLLVFVEPDFGTTMLIAAVGMLMMFIGGTRFSFLLVSGFMGFMALAFLILQNPERSGRILAFKDPLKHSQGEAYQLVNALCAFVLGAETGVGLGNSMQKRFYLPEAHTDFIFAIIGEELGFPGTMTVVLLFLIFLICGWVISLNAGDVFGRLLGLGITMMITLQAAINMMVVTGLLPTKGLALPFISFGGSSFVVNGMMLGILINIGLSEGRAR